MCRIKPLRSTAQRVPLFAIVREGSPYLIGQHIFPGITFFLFQLEKRQPNKRGAEPREAPVGPCLPGFRWLGLGLRWVVRGAQVGQDREVLGQKI